MFHTESLQLHGETVGNVSRSKTCLCSKHNNDSDGNLRRLGGALVTSLSTEMASRR